MARAQQPERMRHIMFLHALAEDDPEVQNRITAFRQGLEMLGWTENRNIQIEHRFSGGDLSRIQAHAAEIVSSVPDLIVVSSTAAVAGAPSRLSSLWLAIQSDKASSPAWRVRAATSLASHTSTLQ